MSNRTGFDLTIENLFTLMRQVYYSKTESENRYAAKSGGTITGSLTIQGNLTIAGQQYVIDTTKLDVKDYTITLAKDNTQTLTSMVGMVVPNYDGTNYGFFGWDADGYAYVGDLTNYDGTSPILKASHSGLQKLATIDTSATSTIANGKVMVYDEVAHQFKNAPQGTYVIQNGRLAEASMGSYVEVDYDGSHMSYTLTQSQTNTLLNENSIVGLDSGEGIFYLKKINSVTEGGITVSEFEFDKVELSATTISFMVYKAILNHSNYQITFSGDEKETYTKDSLGNYLNEKFAKNQVSSVETTNTASKNYAVGDLLIYNETLYKVTTAIASGDTIAVGTNVSATTVEGELANKVDKVSGKGLSTNDYIDTEKSYVNEHTLNSLNLWKFEQTIISQSSSGTPEVRTLTVEPNTTYTFSVGANPYQVGIYDYGTNITSTMYSGTLQFTFTTGATTTQVDFYFRTTSSDTYTYTKIMLNKGSHAYPHSEFNQKEHITNDEATLLKNECEKSLQIWDEQYRLGYYGTGGAYNSGSTTICSTNYISVNSNTTYYFSNNKLGRICYYDSSKTFISYQDYSQTFTTPSNCAYIRFDMATGYGTTYNNDIVISKEGAIVHEKDIEPVLLWENSSPNSAYTSVGSSNLQTLSQSRTNFKFLKLMCKIYMAQGYGLYCITIDTTNTYYHLSLCYGNAQGNQVNCRGMQFQSDTQFYFDNNYNGGQIDNDRLIPIRIYGTNTL